MIEPCAIAAAAQRLAPYVRNTELVRSDPLSQRHGAEVFIKCEHLQRTGSFKVRGSANVVHSLDDAQAAQGVVTASSGNHGIGVATAAASRGVASTIFLPRNVSPSKHDAIVDLGAQVVLVESTDPFQAEIAARRHSDETGVQYVSPYNDPGVIAGQGTIGLEVLGAFAERNLGSPDTIVVSVGGGGLISGIATWFKAHSPTTRVVGASALNDRAMAASIDAGEIITPEFAPTFSDGTAGALDDGSITFPICQALVDEWIDITEPQIATAVTAMVDDHHQLVEGAAGVALAGAAQIAEREPGSSIVAISCGGNVSSTSLRDMLEMAAASSPAS